MWNQGGFGRIKLLTIGIGSIFDLWRQTFRWWWGRVGVEDRDRVGIQPGCVDV